MYVWRKIGFYQIYNEINNFNNNYIGVVGAGIISFLLMGGIFGHGKAFSGGKSFKKILFIRPDSTIKIIFINIFNFMHEKFIKIFINTLKMKSIHCI